MDPFRPVTIDARMPAAQFLDGGPVSDGIANLIASAINAPLAASQVRRQRQMDERQASMQDQGMERQAQQDQLAQLWHGQNQDRQGRQDALAAEFQKAQIANMQSDNARQMMAMFGNGANNVARRGIDAVKAIGGLFGKSKGTATQPAAADWYIFDGPEGKMKINKRTGEILPAVAAAAAVPPDQVTTPDAGEQPGFFASQAQRIGDFWSNPTMTPRWSSGGQETPAAAVDPQALTQTSQSMRRGAPLAPAGAAQMQQPVVDDGMRAWHQLGRQDPAEFRRQMLAIKASDPQRYASITAAIRSISGK